MNIRSIISNVSCFVLILILSFIFLTNTVGAETKTFIKEYNHYAGDADTKNSSRIISLRQVKKLLLVELSTYLENKPEIKNFELTKDQITTLTAVMVSTEVIKDKWDGKVYWLKAEITANPQDVIKSIDSLPRHRETLQELVELRKKSEELLKENERLNKELKTAKSDAKQELAQAYNRNINILSATEWIERGYELALSENYTDAEKAFSKAIELDPQYAMTYYHRGCAYKDLGNYQQAINDFDKAIELNPQYVLAYVRRGNAYGMNGNNERAFENLKIAAKLGDKSSQDFLKSKGVSW